MELNWIFGWLSRRLLTNGRIDSLIQKLDGSLESTRGAEEYYQRTFLFEWEEKVWLLRRLIDDFFGEPLFLPSHWERIVIDAKRAVFFIRLWEKFLLLAQSLESYGLQNVIRFCSDDDEEKDIIDNLTLRTDMADTL